MKTNLLTKKINQWMLLLITSAALVVACNKNDDSHPQAPEPTMNCYQGQVAPPGYLCVYNTGAQYVGTGNLVNNVRFSYSSLGLEGVISLSATATNSYVDFNDPRVPAKYFGSFTAQGTVSIQSDVTCGGIPLRGDYVLNGAQGMYSAGILSGFVWNLVGPANLQLTAHNSSVLVGDMNGLSRDGNNRLGLSVSVYVNNQYCGYIYTR